MSMGEARWIMSHPWEGVRRHMGVSGDKWSRSREDVAEV
jgi:hypothetical protein